MLTTCLSGLFLLTATIALSAPIYTVVPLGKDVVPTAINNIGQVVGYERLGTDLNRGFLYSNGTMKSVGPLPGDMSSVASGINDRGEVVGYSFVDRGAAARGFLYRDGLMNILPTLPGNTDFIAEDINQAGKVVGRDGIHALLYSDGKTMSLSYGDAYAINDADQVVGVSGNSAFLYKNGNMEDLGVLLPNSMFTAALAINNVGEVVLLASSYSTSVSYLYSNGQLTTLLPRGNTISAGLDVNDLGKVVGWSSGGGTSAHAFLYEDSNIYNLNQLLSNGSGWNLLTASGINNSGQIVGEALINHEGVGFLATPTQVPEPATVSLCGSALVCIAVLRFVTMGRTPE